MDIIKTLAEEFKLKVEQVEKTVELIDGGDTIPFIARYRKEETGSLDDNVLRELDDRLTYLRNIEKRKEEVRNLITEMGKMTDEIAAAIDAAKTITEVDDIYRPFRPHRKTRAFRMFIRSFFVRPFKLDAFLYTSCSWYNTMLHNTFNIINVCKMNKMAYFFALKIIRNFFKMFFGCFLFF